MKTEEKTQRQKLSEQLWRLREEIDGNAKSLQNDKETVEYVIKAAEKIRKRITDLISTPQDVGFDVEEINRQLVEINTEVERYARFDPYDYFNLDLLVEIEEMWADECADVTQDG